LQKAILFYKANRLGDLPDDYILPYRADAAMTDGQDVVWILPEDGLMPETESNLPIPCPMPRANWAGLCMNIVRPLKRQAVG